MELSENENWICGLEGRYSINEEGTVRSHRRSEPAIMKTYQRNGYWCIGVFLEDETRYWKISDLMAETFLGTKHYIFIDGNRSNHALSNLRAAHDELAEGEQWIDGFEGRYSIDSSGNVHSFKGHRKHLIGNGRSKDGRRFICLNVCAGRRMIDVDKLVSKYL